MFVKSIFKIRVMVLALCCFSTSLWAAEPGTLKWSYKTGDYVRSCPAIGSDGTIYVGSYDDKLYAIKGESGGLADTPWPMFHHDLKHTGRFNFKECTKATYTSSSGELHIPNLVVDGEAEYEVNLKYWGTYEDDMYFRLDSATPK